MSNQSLYAMYVIGTVESNCNWAAVNPTDPITLGMMQWYGQRAANLIKKCEAHDSGGATTFYAAAPRIKNGLINGEVWEKFILTAEEANAWKAWAKNKENHAGQQEQWEEDFASYQQTCDSVGIPSANIRERIMFMCAYHQSPRQALRVIGSVGGTSDLDRIHSGILADSVLGGYPNRYNTAYNLLKNWDGQSAPPDFGQDGDSSSSPTSGNSAPSVTPKPDEKITVSRQGDCLLVTVGDKMHVAFKGASETWIAKSSGGKPISSGTTNGGTSSGDASGDAKKIIDWIAQRADKFAYSQGAGRLNPDQSGYTDCSGLIWSAYHFAAGNDSTGTWTGDEAKKGNPVISSQSSTVDKAISMAKPGDILLITWGGHNPNYDHEEIFSTDVHQTWSQGGPGNGPKQMQASSEMGAASEWEIRRHL